MKTWEAGCALSERRNFPTLTHLIVFSTSSSDSPSHSPIDFASGGNWLSLKTQQHEQMMRKIAQNA